MPLFGPLVTTDWLAERLNDPDVKIIDGSWRMPGAPSPEADFTKRHIPGAVFVDIDEIADHSSALPHMLPSPDVFEARVGAFGISNASTVIVYDEAGCFSAARVWWMFRAMGHKRVAVLDGGLPKWRRENRPLTDAPTPAAPAVYRARLQDDWVCSAKELRDSLNREKVVVLDARPRNRFHGRAPEPRPGLRSGHMPNAVSLPHTETLTDDGTFLPPRHLAETFSAAGVDKETTVITTCGSGVTAAVLSLALELAGCQNHKLYDGSWAEWGDARNDDREYPVIGGQSTT